MVLFAYILFFCSTFLAMDALYSLYNFQFAYLLELKRRYVARGKDLPFRYRQKLAVEIERDYTTSRQFVQASFIPWFVLCFFTNLWIVPLVITGFVGLGNLFYPKPYISPLVFLFNHILMFSCHLFVILCMVMGLIK